MEGTVSEHHATLVSHSLARSPSVHGLLSTLLASVVLGLFVLQKQSEITLLQGPLLPLLPLPLLPLALLPLPLMPLALLPLIGLEIEVDDPLYSIRLLF